MLTSNAHLDVLMLRGPILLSSVALRGLTLAIALVVGLDVDPHISTRGMSASVVSQLDQTVLEDAYRGGQRLDPRLSPAHFLDRVLPAHTSRRSSAVEDKADALALGAATSADRSQGQRLPIVKHVPRMERGDPPRI